MERMLKRVGLGRKQPQTPSDDSMSRRRRRSKSRRRHSNTNSLTNQDVDGAGQGTPVPTGTSTNKSRLSTTTNRSGTATKASSDHHNNKSSGVFGGGMRARVGAGVISIAEYVRECRPPSCRPRALTRRLCRGRRSEDNELYRSNSFKFERFVRGKEDVVNTLEKQISLCDEYSLPLDHVGRRRDITTGTRVGWSTPSPTVEKVQFIEAYCEPKDSKTASAPSLTAPNPVPASVLVPTAPPYQDFSPRKNPPLQSHSADVDSDAPNSEEEDDFCTQCNYPGYNTAYSSSFVPTPGHVHQVTELNSPDSISEAFPHGTAPLSHTAPKRHPSPYYYADLYRKSNSLDAPSHNETEPGVPKRYSVTEDGFFRAVLSDAEEEDDMPPRRLACACADVQAAIDGTGAQLEDAEDMARRRPLYETAFDSRVSRSDDDLDELDRVSNHPVLLQLDCPSKVSRSTSATAGCSSETTGTPKERRKISLTRPKSLSSHSHLYNYSHQGHTQSFHQNHDYHNHNNMDNGSSVSALSQELDNMNLQNNDEGSSTGDKVTPSPQLPLRGYPPSPPSTAPLPAKFPGKSDLQMMNSIRSAPTLAAHPRLKDLRLPVKSLRARDSPPSSTAPCVLEIKGRPAQPREKLILEFKGRPASEHSTRQDKWEVWKGRASGVGGNRTNTRTHKYSSTESVATSSSGGGSMESLRSSTSEGNRSTSSSDSRQSTSLSSHSSDSGAGYHHGNTQMSVFLNNHANKLHILSPISDKEPASEASADNNRNNNSQRCSPADEGTNGVIGVNTTTALGSERAKKRTPQNKNLLNLQAFQKAQKRVGDVEIQGSDSGISIQSREGLKFLSLSGDGQGLGVNLDMSADIADGRSLDPGSEELSELPFDMPKLRRRRQFEIAAVGSGSLNSVQDLSDLPFDMPKLRRRKQAEINTGIAPDSGASLASSSQSVRDADRQVALFRPKLTLNLGETNSSQRQRPGLGLNLSVPPPRAELVDVDLPLEKQGWYHGAITRVEAECVLRLLREGSFLVRNSESTRQDYSLSLKSARGFMHMRIQRTIKDGSSDNIQFILGQFSKPFDSVPEMIRHFTLNRLPVRGAEHMCLLQPVVAQLL